MFEQVEQCGAAGRQARKAKKAIYRSKFVVKLGSTSFRILKADLADLRRIFVDMYDYLDTGEELGRIAAVITFIISWIYCTATYGFLLGFGLGWLASALAGIIAYFLVMYLWGPIVLIICGVIIAIVTNH